MLPICALVRCDEPPTPRNRPSLLEFNTVRAHRVLRSWPISPATTGIASSAREHRASPSPRTSSSAASRSIASSARPISAVCGTSPPTAASSTRPRIWSPPATPPPTTTCRWAMMCSRPTQATQRCSDIFAATWTNSASADDIEFGKSVTRVAARADKLWEVSVAGEDRPRIYRGVVMASGHHDVPRMPDISRPVRRRDHPLARLQEPAAGARQARAGGRMRQLRGRYRVGCGARRLARLHESQARLLVRAEVHAGLPDPRCRLVGGVLPSAASRQALAVPGQPVGSAGTAVALPAARSRLLDRPGAPHHERRDPAPVGARAHHHQAGNRRLRRQAGSVHGRHRRDRRHDHLCHRLRAGRAVPRRRARLRCRGPVALLPARRASRAPGPVRGRTRAGQRQHVAHRRLPGSADRQPDRRPGQGAGLCRPLPRRHGRRRRPMSRAARSWAPTGIAWRPTTTTIGACSNATSAASARCAGCVSTRRTPAGASKSVVRRRERAEEMAG